MITSLGEIRSKVFLVGLSPPVELRKLVESLELKVVGEGLQSRKSLESATILGKGKLLELATQAQGLGADLLVFDLELTASQMKNIKKLTGFSVIDRCHVILEIFASHARTRGAKIQIEIARLQYLLPRLAGFWGHLSRQRGGIGVRGGEGEQQIELDRRMIRRRIEFYKRQLKGLKRARFEQGKKRRAHALTVALVGYTNAGKSSLMNRLCQTQVEEKDQLFVTLDATFRALDPHTRPPLVLIDTVGFLSNLPNTLISGFKTTLESAMEADLLVVVCDLSDPRVEEHIQVVEDVLGELGLGGKDRFLVFTKADLVKDSLRRAIIKRQYLGSMVVSSLDSKDMLGLRERIVRHFVQKWPFYGLFIPYEDGHGHAEVASRTNIVSQKNHQDGVYYQVRAPKFIFDALSIKKYETAPGEES